MSEMIVKFHCDERGIARSWEETGKIIRCKDCKYWYKDADSGMSCEYTEMSQPEYGFCNWAERKEE